MLPHPSSLCQLNSRRFSRQRGITLVETLIALSIIGAVAVAFLAGLTGSLRATIIADEHTVAESLARSQVEAIKKAAYDDDYDDVEIETPQGYDIEIEVEELDVGLQKITVAVLHGDKTVLVVESYKLWRD